MWAAGVRDVVSRGQVEGLGASRNAHGRDVSPAKQTDRSRESVFSSGRKVSTSGSNHEVIAIYQQLYRLPPDILRPFFLFVFPAPARAVAKNLTCKPRKARLMALRLKSRGIQQRRLTLRGSLPSSLT